MAHNRPATWNRLPNNVREVDDQYVIAIPFNQMSGAADGAVSGAPSATGTVTTQCVVPFYGIPGSLTANVTRYFSSSPTQTTAALTAESSVAFAGIQNIITANQTTYIGPADNAENTTEDISWIVPEAGFINALFAAVKVAPGAATTLILTVRKNGADTASTCTISAAGLSASDVTNSIAVAAGDKITISCAALAGSSAEDLDLSIRYQITAGTSAAVTGIAENATENRFFVVPAAGTVKGAYARVGTAPGGTDTVTLTLRKNAADTANVITITGVGTTGNDTTNTVAVAAGDRLSVSSVTSATAGAANLDYGLLYEITGGSGTMATSTHTHTSGAVRSAGAGNPVFEEVGTTGLVGLRMEATGDDIHHVFAIPNYVDTRHAIEFAVVFSTDQTTTTDGFTWKVLLDQMDPEDGDDAITAPATALDTTIVEKLNAGTANAPQRTAWGTLNGNTLNPDEAVHVLVELDAVTGATLATDKVYGLWLLVRYTAKYL